MRVRISVANLAPMMRVPCGNVNSLHCIGILNTGSYKKGKKLIGPIGGAAQLTEEGQNYLAEKFGAENFHRSEGKIDARFEIDDEHLTAVMAFFSERRVEYFEIDPMREILDELSRVELLANEHFLEIPAVLTPEETGQIRVVFDYTAAQPFSDEQGESPLAKEGVPSRRLFHNFVLEIPSREMFEKILTSPGIVELSLEELETLNGGRNKGRTKDGVTIADNFI